MKILIIGAGEAGFYIATEFSEGNDDVSLIDEDPIRLKSVQRSLNIAGFLGSGTSLSVLERAGVKSADLIIACTDHDETNLICCLLANHYKVKHKIALTKKETFLRKKNIKKYLESGVTQIINASVLIAQEIIATAELASSSEVYAFGEKSVLLVGYRVTVDSPWTGKFLKEVRPQGNTNQFLVASIVREGKSFIPSGDDQIQSGDYVYILIPRDIAHQLNKVLNVKLTTNRKAVIAGENQIAIQVAHGLLKSHYDVTMICSDENSKELLTRRFAHKKKFMVIKGDCHSVKLLLKQDVALSALFVAVTGNDHLNISTGVVANYLGARKTICVVNRQDLVQAAKTVDLDVVLSPRLSTARQVKRIIRTGKNTANYTTISETNMEVIEMVTGKESPALGVPLKNLKLPANTLVGALIKSQNKVIIPTGETIIEWGDKVIMVTMPENVPKLKEKIEGSQKNGFYKNGIRIVKNGV